MRSKDIDLENSYEVWEYLMQPTVKYMEEQMNEIEKMYKNAGVELIEGLEWVCQNPDHCVYQNLSVTPENCIGCEHFEREMRFPPFTAEKQIELIKFLLKNYKSIDINKRINRFNFLVDNATFIGCHHNDKSFEESLAGVINKLWADMSEEEKQQVKGILE